MGGKLDYCTECGRELKTQHIEGRNRRCCRECDRVEYQNPKPCAGILVVDEDELLLIKRKQPPSVGAWSLPAGYLEADEPPEKAAVRELEEEASLQTTVETLTLVDTVFVRHPDGSHVLVIVYAISRDYTSGEAVAGSDAGAAQYWNIENLEAHETEHQNQDILKPCSELNRSSKTTHS
ncbi:NUDIX domain-containing protein [Haladaptatus sp. GCM10025893]|uniref:NUDIX domain-containing protein n=1 Tax=Haladaptatus sp. GCM10025893 TaxID=3252659 RepID=UPI00361ECBAB